MIDKADKKTQDAFNKKRGRPVTGTAMSPAERKRASRERAMFAALKGASYSELSLTALVERLGRAVTAGNVSIVSGITKELTARTKANKVTVTKNGAK